MFTHLVSLENASWFPWLLDLLVKSAVLLALAGVASLACWRASAAQRHLLWLLAVVGVLLLPVLAAVLPAWQVVRVPEWRPSVTRVAAPVAPVLVQTSPVTRQETPRVATPVAPSALTPSAGVDTPSVSTTPVQVAPPPHAPALPWSLVVMVVWGIGVKLILARWVYGMAAMRRIRARAVPAPAAWTEGMAVRVRVSDTLAMPVVVGGVRPTILLPAQAAEWPEERRRVVLLHELAHVQRRDLLAQLLAHLACALYWPNPLIWLAAHRLRLERELACDDAVLRAAVKPSVYAVHLLAIAATLRHRPPLTGIAMARSSKVGQRIKAVLDARRNRRGVTWWGAALAVLIAAVLFTALAMAEEGVEKLAVSYADPLVQIAFAQKQIRPQGFGSPLRYDSPYPVISPDGSRILFIANRGWEIDGHAETGANVFTYHRDTGQIDNLNMLGRSQGRFGRWLGPTHLNRVSWDGRVTANGTDPDAVISPDGRIEASFKETIDTKSDRWTCYLTFFDRETGTQERVVVPGAHGYSLADARPLSNLQFSQDGRYLAFSAQYGKGWQDSHGGGASDSWREVMVYDRVAKQLAFANVNEKGERVSVPCSAPHISADGRYVLFEASSWAGESGSSEPDNIRAWKRQQRLFPDGPQSGVYLYDTDTKQVRRFSQQTVALTAARAWFYPITSEDGRFSVSEATAEKEAREHSEILLHDAETGTVQHVSEGGRAIGAQLGLPYSAHTYPTISKDGRYISYVTKMSNVKFWDSAYAPDDPKWHGIVHLAVAIQIYDRETAKTTTALLATDLPGKVTIPGASRTATTATIPTFTTPTDQPWQPVVASPSGRYLVVQNPRVPGGSGLWVDDLQTGTWTKVWDRQGDVQWLPNETGMIVAIGGAREHEDGRPRPRCTFYRVPLTGETTQLTELTDLCDWAVIPDGSGLVATRYADKRQHDGLTEVRVETRVYPFAERKWVTRHITPFIWPDGLIGDDLVLRKHHGAWVLSYVEGRTGDNSEWWVNLTTGEGMKAHHGDRIYSPDGQYAVDGNRLYRARTWPTPPTGRDWGGNALANEIHTFPMPNINADWAPDSRHIAFHFSDDANKPHFTVFALNGSRVFSVDDVFETWVGPAHVLIRQDDRDFLYAITGGASQEIFRIDFPGTTDNTKP